MKIERLRKSHRKEIIMGVVFTVVIGGTLTFRLTHSKYRYTESIDLAEGVIHYKAPDFQVMAIKVSDDGENYSDSDVIPTGNYVINEEKTYCKTSSGEEVKGKIKSVNGIHGLYNINKGDKCYLYFDKGPSISDTILANITVNSGTPIFSNFATTDEGVYAVSDGMYGGTSYYWRGAVENNYVKFANFCWRIIRINGDGTLRLIYAGTTCQENNTITDENIAVTGQPYNSIDNQMNYAGWTYAETNQRPCLSVDPITGLTTGGTPCNAKLETETWYTTNITNKDFEDKVAKGKFCNNRNVESGYTWEIKPSSTFKYEKRIHIDSGAPTLSCPSGDEYTLKVGAISADEVMYAGGTYKNNSSYYLYTGREYWTMSPAYWNGGIVAVFCVKAGGSMGIWSIDSTTTGLRPVINLKSDVTFSSGNGLKDSPYTVSN